MELRSYLRLTMVVACLALTSSLGAADAPIGCLASPALVAHGGGLNACGCHFNRKTGDCHCHQPRGCGCPCQPAGCK